MPRTYTNNSQMDERIRQEIARILHSKRAPMIFGSLGVSIMTTWLLWPLGMQPGLSIWLAANIALTALRWHISQGYIDASTEMQNAHHNYWTTWFTLGSFTNGVLWGLVPVFFFTPDLYYFAIILVIHAGYVGAASSATSATPYTFINTYSAFSVPATLMFVIATLVNGGWEWFGFAFMVLFYLVPTAYFARNNTASLIEQIKLRLENTNLLSDLRDQRDRAELAMLAKNRFLAAASHDLRQPVHALGLFAGSLESHLHSEEPKRILSKIKQSTAALGGLFHGLLDISKLDANVVENFPQHVNLDQMLAPLQAEFDETARYKGLTLNIPTRTNHVAFVDPSLLERILRNMVSNAINYTDHGSVTLTVDVDAESKLIISITDTGKGIPEPELENIFSEYHQLENPERNRQRGLGLGLAIVRRLCTLMDIPISVESTVGQGSTFSVSVPSGDHNQLDVKPRFNADDTHCHRLNVAVIDDEVDILDGMEQLLNDWGCHTVSATSTEAALVALSDEDVPDIIIADFRLRDNESGLDAIRQIRDEFNTEIPALLVTGDTAPERLQQALAASVRVMHKPVEPDQLKSMLHQLTTAEIEA